MSNKRKDHKGRLLRTGESQRGDLIYQYRYTDLCGKRRSIYDSDLPVSYTHLTLPTICSV